MKVLLIATTKFELDGITNVIMNYYRSIDKKDIEFDFVVPNEINDSLKSEIQSNSSNVYVLKGRMKKPFKYINELSKIIKNNEYDVVHAHGNSHTLALEMIAAKKGKAKVRIPHSHNSTCKYKTIHKLLTYSFNKNYTLGFACGEKAGKWLYGNKPFIVINNGINIEKFQYNETVRNEIRKKYGFENCKVVLHIGHFTYQKNHEYLIDIFSELFKTNKNYRLFLLGDGPLKKEVQEKVNRLKLNNVIIFTGKTPDAHKFLQAADLFLMPSRYEGLPLTLIEAQSAGLPCFVSSNVSKEAALTDLVKFIDLENSPKDWAEIINSEVINDRNLITEKVTSEIRKKGYDIKENAKFLKNIYFTEAGKII